MAVKLNLAKAKPGPVDDPLHFHQTRITYFCVLSGELCLEVGGESVSLTKHRVLEILPNEQYRVVSAGHDGCEWLVIGSHSEDDRVEVQTS